MRKAIVTSLFVILYLSVIACPVCERNKPKILQGITHGSNPDSNWDYLIVTTMGIITILTLFYSIKFLIQPKENNTTHIKYSFLTEQ
jgi:hypothetical protein